MESLSGYVRREGVKMVKSKKMICFLVCVLVFIGCLVFLDQQTTYLVVVHQNNVEVLNGNIIIEMSSATSVGYFRKVIFEEIDNGIYSIEAYFSLLSGEYSGYKYKIDNSDNYIKEIRQYSLDSSGDYTVIYQNNN